jgi:predicted dehydrogenase
MVSETAVVRHHLLRALPCLDWRLQVLAGPSERNPAATAAIAGRSGTRIRRADQTKAAAAFGAAIVAAPHTSHGLIGTALIASGKHVFMDKLLATDSDDARLVLETAARSDKPLSVGLLRRYLHIACRTRRRSG